jgi:hypothetical protein
MELVEPLFPTDTAAHTVTHVASLVTTEFATYNRAQPIAHATPLEIADTLTELGLYPGANTCNSFERTE